MIIFAVIWECYTDRSPIIPPRLFKACGLLLLLTLGMTVTQTRTTSIILIAVFFHGFALFTGKILPLCLSVLPLTGHC